jgi:signal peptidase II
MKRFSLVLIGMIVGLDQITKFLILEHFAFTQTPTPIFPFFNLVLAWNRGISFGLFHSFPEWGYWGITIVVIIVTIGLIMWLLKVRKPWNRLALSLIIGGAVGNIIDRILRGAVVDFLDIYWGSWHWPAFNMADSAITIGISILIYRTLILKDGIENYEK